MKKILTGALMVLALLFGATATAQADVEPMTSASTVLFTNVLPDVPATIDLYNTSTTGYEYTQALHTSHTNVAKVCPKNDYWFLQWTGPTGDFHSIRPGACVVLTIPGTFQFQVGAASNW
jgi:hypothetical protein